MPLVASRRESESPEVSFDLRKREARWLDATATLVTVDNILRSRHFAYPLQPLERVWPGSGSWAQWFGISSEFPASMSILWEPARLLGRFYLLRDELEVGEFIERHPFLLPLLREARVHIHEHFPGEEVALEVVVDPEEPDFEELFAYIQTDLPPEDALSRLRQLDSDWWLEAMPRAQNKVCIHLELR